jgi:hypothetical protein
VIDGLSEFVPDVLKLQKLIMLLQLRLGAEQNLNAIIFVCEKVKAVLRKFASQFVGLRCGHGFCTIADESFFKEGAHFGNGDHGGTPVDGSRN